LGTKKSLLELQEHGDALEAWQNSREGQ
jgi:hypothetical protein